MRQELVRMTIVALTWKIGYKNSNPDIGMGPSKKMLLEDVCEEAGIKLTDEEFNYVMMACKAKMR